MIFSQLSTSSVYTTTHERISVGWNRFGSGLVQNSEVRDPNKDPDEGLGDETRDVTDFLLASGRNVWRLILLASSSSSSLSDGGRSL